MTKQIVEGKLKFNKIKPSNNWAETGKVKNKTPTACHINSMPNLMGMKTQHFFD